jgi:hypothetical protein
MPARGNGTDHTGRVLAPRSRRVSMHNGVKVTWGVVWKLGGLIVAVIAGVWIAGQTFNEKADRSRVRALEQRHDADIHRLDLGLYKVRYEQRVLMDAVAPGVSARLEPLPPEPELEPTEGE